VQVREVLKRPASFRLLLAGETETTLHQKDARLCQDVKSFVWPAPGGQFQDSGPIRIEPQFRHKESCETWWRPSQLRDVDRSKRYEGIDIETFRRVLPVESSRENSFRIGRLARRASFTSALFALPLRDPEQTTAPGIASTSTLKLSQ